MTLVTVTQAKANLSKLLAMAERGGEVIIGRAERPAATLTPISPKRKKRVLGLGQGKGWMSQDFDTWPEEEARALGIID